MHNAAAKNLIGKVECKGEPNRLTLCKEIEPNFQDKNAFLPPGTIKQ